MNEASQKSTGQLRTVLDGVGHSLVITIQAGRMIMSDPLIPDARVEMEKDEAEIFHAFLAVSLKMPHRSDFSEDLKDGRTLSLQQQGSTHVRLSWKDGGMDIYPPSWEPLLCEISLILPRLKD